jgi:hypothetical protein
MTMLRCAEMLTGFPPFSDRNFNAMCDKILHKPVRSATAEFKVRG